MEFGVLREWGGTVEKWNKGARRGHWGGREVTDGVESPHERKNGSRTLSGRWAAAENTHGASLLFSSLYVLGVRCKVCRIAHT